MANLQVKNVPDALYRRIRKAATQEGRTMRDFLLDAVRSKLERDEFYDRLSRRRPVEIGRRASKTLDEVRGERNGELGR